MPYTLLGEFWKSRTSTVGWQGSKEDLIYLISGGEDDAQARLCVAANAPATIANPGDPTTIFENYDLEYQGGNLWIATIHYAQRTPKAPGDTTYNFETGGGTQKITQSISTSSSYKAGGGTPEDFQGAIGCTDGQRVEGVEINVPVFNFSETHYVPITLVNDSFKENLFTATGKTNNAAWRNFDIEEVLFLGASGTQRGQDDWEITYKFAGSEGIVGATIGPFTGVNKNGWDYIWFRYQTDVSANALIQKPVAAYVEKVYESCNFATLIFP
jgi:hypothetical protein